MEQALAKAKAELREKGWDPVMERYRRKYKTAIMDANPHDMGPVFEGHALPYYATKYKLYLLYKNHRTKVVPTRPPSESGITPVEAIGAGTVVAGSLLLVHHTGHIEHVGTVLRETAGKVADGIRDVRDAMRPREVDRDDWIDHEWVPDIYE